MAHHKSAKKRIGRNDRARVRNRQYLSSVRTAVKKLRAAVAEGNFDKSVVTPLFITAQSLLAKAASKGILHKNNVTRKIGRLSKLLSSAEAGTLPTAAVAKKKSTKPKTAAKAAPAAAAPKTAKAAAPKKAPAKKTSKK